MRKDWEAKNEKDVKTLSIEVRRHLKYLLNLEKKQFENFMNYIEEFKSNPVTCSPSRKVIFDRSNPNNNIFEEYELVSKTESGKNVYSIVTASIDTEKNKFNEFHSFIAENENELSCLNLYDNNYLTDRVSPFGGANSISKEYLCNRIVYESRYINNRTKGYAIEKCEFTDLDNFIMIYSKLVDGKPKNCGYVECFRGKITGSSFDSKKDFKAICNLYKNRDILNVAGYCQKHVEESRRER